jgi:hypothetical protein
MVEVDVQAGRQQHQVVEADASGGIMSLKCRNCEASTSKLGAWWQLKSVISAKCCKSGYACIIESITM